MSKSVLKRQHRPPMTRVRKIESLSPQVVRETSALLRADTRVSAKALRFMILTGARLGEVRSAQWSEVDWQAATWTISAATSKSRRSFCVALSRQAVELLQALPRVESVALIFPSEAGAPLSEWGLIRTVHAMKVERVYSFRTSFYEWRKESTGLKDRPLELGRELMQSWANSIDAH